MRFSLHLHACVFPQRQHYLRQSNELMLRRRRLLSRSLRSTLIYCKILLERRSSLSHHAFIIQRLSFDAAAALVRNSHIWNDMIILALQAPPRIQIETPRARAHFRPNIWVSPTTRVCRRRLFALHRQQRALLIRPNPFITSVHLCASFVSQIDAQARGLRSKLEFARALRRKLPRARGYIVICRLKVEPEPWERCEN